MTWYVLRYCSHHRKWKNQDFQYESLAAALEEASELMEHLLAHEKREYVRVEIAQFEGKPNNVR